MNSTIKPWMIVAGVFALVGIIAGFSFYGYYNNVRNDALEKERAVMKQYDANQVSLTSATMKISETLNVADSGSEAVKEIFAGAIEGRYSTDVKPDGTSSLINALSIQEDNPDVEAIMKNYTKVQDVITSSRNAFANEQRKLIDQAGAYNVWLDSNIVRSQIVKTQGFPSDRLTVTKADGSIVTGADALKIMSTPLVDQSTKTAFDTGIIESPILKNK
jgi:hypothetical protein